MRSSVIQVNFFYYVPEELKESQIETSRNGKSIQRADTEVAIEFHHPPLACGAFLVDHDRSVSRTPLQIVLVVRVVIERNKGCAATCMISIADNSNVLVLSDLERHRVGPIHIEILLAAKDNES